LREGRGRGEKKRKGRFAIHEKNCEMRIGVEGEKISGTTREETSTSEGGKETGERIAQTTVNVRSPKNGPKKTAFMGRLHRKRLIR